MTLTIDSTTVPNLIAVENAFLDLEFREKRRMLSSKLRVKQRLTTGKEVKRLTFAWLLDADWVYLKSKINGSFFPVVLTGLTTAQNFSANFEIELESYSYSYNGSVRDITIILNPE